jgi:aryl-phospho-beta-D-glucosidase BglC (GH1 family)
MIPTADCTSIAAFFLSACLALFAGSCLTPPAARGLGKPSDAPRATVAAAPSLGDFTRTSPELFAKLRLGWNLGNSLDAPGGETAWGNPRVTPELLATVAKEGFGLVRIPVTWAQHMGPAPRYVIDGSWLERVAEVVGFARSAGLYSIINLHHDGADGMKEAGWLSLKDANGQTTAENNAAVKAQFVAVWTQIARYFANQGEELMFESMNEVHDGYGKADPRHIEIVNDLNQAFVNLVRASGGNNTRRHLIVPSYNTDINYALKGFKLPIDSAKNRLILSVHCYDPYLFALMGKTHTWGRASPGRDDWGQEDYIVAQFDKLKAHYVDQGVPVLIGEYGATHQEGYEDYRRYYMEYVTKAAVDRGLVPVYWDNGGSGSGGESFALIDRQNHSVFHPKIMEAMLRAATRSYSLRDIAPPVPAK